MPGSVNGQVTINKLSRPWPRKLPIEKNGAKGKIIACRPYLCSLSGRLLIEFTHLLFSIVIVKSQVFGKDVTRFVRGKRNGGNEFGSDPHEIYDSLTNNQVHNLQKDPKFLSRLAMPVSPP